MSRIHALALAMSVLGDCAAASAQHLGHDTAGATEHLGRVNFPISCSAEAKRQFERALSLLHSFEYDQAEPAFVRVAKTDTACAMAHWGVAMSRLHPLWTPPSAADIEVATSALQRAEALNAGTDRERAFLDAIATYYREHDRVDHVTRLRRYEDALASLAKRFPRDAEAQIFSALGMVGVAMALPVDTAYTRRRRAGAILEALLPRQPDHPGLAHYIIHAYDVPALSTQAIRAAQRYAVIAPASPHAQHMPSHIFTRRGMWDESIASNRRTADVALAFERKHGVFVQDYLHALDYLAFAYLQQGRDSAARQVLEEAARADTLKPGGHFASFYALAAIPARHALERGKWRDAAQLELREPSEFLPAQAVARFARGLGAARAGDTVLARAEEAALAEIRDRLSRAGESQWAREVESNRLAVITWLAHAAADTVTALMLADSAATLEDGTEKHPVMPGRILSARLLLGELLLELGRSREAYRAFENALSREPGRVRALHGAAFAAEQAGDLEAARARYGELVKLMARADPGRVELLRARAFLSRTGTAKALDPR
jgi:tetratricopeptide (TPR) repeat protein